MFNILTRSLICSTILQERAQHMRLLPFLHGGALASYTVAFLKIYLFICMFASCCNRETEMTHSGDFSLIPRGLRVVSSHAVSLLRSARYQRIWDLPEIRAACMHVFVSETQAEEDPLILHGEDSSRHWRLLYFGLTCSMANDLRTELVICLRSIK